MIFEIKYQYINDQSLLVGARWPRGGALGYQLLGPEFDHSLCLGHRGLCWTVDSITFHIINVLISCLGGSCVCESDINFHPFINPYLQSYLVKLLSRCLDSRVCFHSDGLKGGQVAGSFDHDGASHDVPSIRIPISST